MNPERPAWLDDEPEIKEWLHEALKRLDVQAAEQRSAPLRFPVEEKRFPSLSHGGPEADARWELIKGLTRLLPLKIVPRRKTNPFAPEYEGARLDLDASAEMTLRGWLQRPRIGPAAQAWQAAIDAADADWSDEARARLRARPIAIPERSAEEVVAALLRLSELRGQPLTLRQMSARAFFGDSKFLETREGLLRTLYPDLVGVPRPLLVAVSLPPTIRGVLFIENQDSYVRAAAGHYPETAGLALVYAAGFKGSAVRIRERSGAVLHYGRSNTESEAFERWWFRDVSTAWPVWFWGDLDFEGLRILKGLRGQFGAAAWQPGYEPLLALLRAGQGHAPEAADKENQHAPERTGCSYADQVLLPALRTARRFVDQEAW